MKVELFNAIKLAYKFGMLFNKILNLQPN